MLTLPLPKANLTKTEDFQIVLIQKHNFCSEFYKFKLPENLSSIVCLH